MYNCECLIHPFQNDPGTSQSDRVVSDLLSGAAKIDARTLADLLDFFTQMSRNINFYDEHLNVSDWQPFFQRSIPFSLASIIKTPVTDIQQNLALYNSLFERRPAPPGLQLLVYFIHYRFINKMNACYLSVKGSGLPIESYLELYIKDKLQQPVKLFIAYTNAAVKWYGIKKIDFSKLSENQVWNIQSADLMKMDDSLKTGGYREPAQILKLYDQVKVLASPFLDAMKTIAVEAGKNLEKSLFPLKEELRKKHPPHLALLFTFLNIFRQLQNDLNGYTRKHLDFFYREVLQIKPGDAVADKAHIIFEIQKQLNKYLLKKGLKVKDGKDSNKQEILFSLDDDIVVNKTEVAELRTLFLNNHIIPGTNKEGKNLSLLEGVYMAPDATKADGVEKDFTTDPRNFYTLGNKESKYIAQGTNVYKPYPNARLGFVLASPVLLLNEGTRTVTITLRCSLDEKICEELSTLPDSVSSNCCDEKQEGQTDIPVASYLAFLPLINVYSNIVNALNTEYYYISESLIDQAILKGLDSKTVLALRRFLISSNKDVIPKAYCYCPSETKRFDAIVLRADFENQIDISSEIVSLFFKKRKPFQILFSGEKDWIDPGDTALTSFEIVPTDFSNQFSFTIKTTINPDKPSVTFYDKEKLNEDLGTELPLVKIELDDHFKVFLDYSSRKNICCLGKDLKFENDKIPFSLYHFFRNVKIENNSKIDVQVCGLRNFIVQNDEGLQDVNGPVYPFGTRPEIKDFTILNPPISAAANLIGPGFYIGSREVFCKKWAFVRINLNWKDKPSDFKKYYQGYLIDGLDKDQFKIMVSVLQNGIWQEEGMKRKLFDEVPPPDFEPSRELCDHQKIYEQGIVLRSSSFVNQSSVPFSLRVTPDFKEYKVDSRYGFIKINLRDQDFLHKDYSFVLARQMTAFGKLPKEKVEGAIYYDSAGNPMVIDFDVIYQKILAAVNESERANKEIVGTDVNGGTGLEGMIPGDVLGFSWNPTTSQGRAIRDRVRGKNELLLLFTNFPGIKNLIGNVKDLVKQVKDSTDPNAKFAAIIPNEPWTPIISNMSLDYTATAGIEDIDLIHLYPYAGTYKHEEIKLHPPLFPTFCDEGTLLLGLKNLVPGENLNLLFQMAEATSDSEPDKQDVQWHYLDNNLWKAMRAGFEVLDDATESLTTSGVIKLALPANMTNTDTIMPAGLHWIKASISQNSRAVSETIAVMCQAISATFTNDTANDKGRLSQPLQAGSISKLLVADAFVKSVNQPFDSFGGQVPEIEQQYYVRVSEQLRHKGRAIQKFDYERLILQQFPQVFKVKCINHSFALDAHLYRNDFPYAPGYVVLAVIPDLNKLQPGNSFEPKVPVSILEKIENYIRERTSPFVRITAMNPRYELINFSLRINLLPGKEKNYYREKLKEDLRELLAPWAVGKYDKLTFGQCVYRSDVIRFLEQTDYVDFITDFKFSKQTEPPSDSLPKVCPDTPRSILIAGDIEVCINLPECEGWEVCKDDNERVIPCCGNEKIPVSDYCKDNPPVIG